ncbi:MAG: hypothetical protein GEV12_13945, partial [Micromonosporaceae bacterium]|nr:hypothetical protein [Micromonosporaceae bacterium]
YKRGRKRRRQHPDRDAIRQTLTRLDLTSTRHTTINDRYALKLPVLTLTAVLGLAAVQGSAGRGTLLAAAYSLGMGLPFIAFAFGLTRLLRLAAFLRRHGAWVTRLGGLLLIAVGLALATGAWNAFITWLRVTVGPGQIGI